MIKIIENTYDWGKLLDKVGNFDLYHTHEYHQISKSKSESPVLIQYFDGINTILLPILIRTIPNTAYFDATSVYGYAGPLANKPLHNFDGQQFNNDLQRILASKKIVSIFSRLHPFIEYQNEILNHCGKVKKKGDVVYLDLTKPNDQLLKDYNKRLRTQVNKANRECTLQRVENQEGIEVFKNIYVENMDRLQADDRYYFDSNYFLELHKSKNIDTHFYLVQEKASNQVIGGGMLFIKGKFAQYHLSAAKEDYAHMSPSKLLIDHMGKISKSKGCKIFNLGGGLGSNDDGLLRFKKLFSKNTKPFYVWNQIVMPDIYRELTKNNPVKKSEDFFPAYR